MDTSTQAAAPVAAVTDTSAQTTPVAPQPAPIADPNAEPAWLKGRLERAERAAEERAIKALGFDSVDAARAAYDAGRKAAEKAAALESLDGENKALRETLGAYAKATLDALGDKHRAAIVALAGDDPKAQLRAVETMRANGLLDAPAQAPTAPQPAAKPAPLPPPATTAAAPTAPVSATPGNPNHAAEYERLLSLNPFRAANYFAANRVAIQAARSAGKPAA